MATLQELIESEIGDFFAGFGSPGEPESPADMQSQLLARITPLIASMGQEPVAYMQINGDEVEYNGHNEFSGGGKGVPLYAAPQLPQPAVSDDIGEIRVGRLPTMNQDDYHGLGEWWVQLRIGEDSDEVLARVYGATPQEANSRAEALACRAAMLQGDEPVRQTNKLRDGLEVIRNSGIAIDAGKIQAERDALNDPVRGWIPCSERMPLTPEEGCEYWDVEVQAFDGERVLIAHYAIGSKPKPWGAWVDTHAEITHWKPLATPLLQEAINGQN